MASSGFTPASPCPLYVGTPEQHFPTKRPQWGLTKGEQRGRTIFLNFLLTLILMQPITWLTIHIQTVFEISWKKELDVFWKPIFILYLKISFWPIFITQFYRFVLSSKVSLTLWSITVFLALKMESKFLLVLQVHTNTNIVTYLWPGMKKISSLTRDKNMCIHTLYEKKPSFLNISLYLPF